MVRGTEPNFFMIGTIFQCDSDNSGHTHGPLLIFPFLNVVFGDFDDGATPTIETQNVVGKLNRFPTLNISKTLVSGTSSLGKVVRAKVLLQDIRDRLEFLGSVRSLAKRVHHSERNKKENLLLLLFQRSKKTKTATKEKKKNLRTAT